MPKIAAGPFLSDVGQRVAEFREIRGMTQEELAEALDWWPRQVQRVEAGEANLSLLRILELSNALCIHPSELLRPPTARRARKPGRPKSTKP